MALPPPASPGTLIADLRAMLAQRGPHHWVAAVLAILVPAAMFTGFAIDARRDMTPPATITYVTSWPADRSDAEIIADQKKRQAALEARQKERQRQFKKIDDKLKRLGI